MRNQKDRINLKKSKDNLDCRHDIEKQNNEKPNFYNENYSEEELKTNKNNNGKIFERINETDEENKIVIEKMKNELGAKNSGNQAVCADTNDNPYNNKMRLELPKDATHDGTNIDLAVTISYGDNSIIKTVKNYY